MAEVIRMPKMSDTMEEGVIALWLKQVGDQVSAGDILAEVETDKATMELESYEDGTLLYIGLKEKEAAPVDGIIAVIGKKGEDYSALLADIPSASSRKEEIIEEVVPPPSENIDITNIKAVVIRMPKMSDTMEEGVIASWLKKVGDKVLAGDILAEVETDKATMELESYDDGELLYIGPQAGESVPVDGILAIIGEKGDDFETLLKAEDSAIKSSAVVEKTMEKQSGKVESTASAMPSAAATVIQSASESNGRLKASPLAKKLAKELGYDLAQITGSGEHGRIIKKDVESFQPSTNPVSNQVLADSSKETTVPVALPQVIGKENYDEVPVSQMRKTIGKRLSESKFSAPHFYITMEINMDKAMEARASMNEISPVKISFNDLVIKAAAAALRQNPKVNVSWLGDKVRYNHHIHIGVAVAVDEGLLVPVIRFADNKSLAHISTEVKDLAKKATNKQLQPKDWEGNTFTISNLGMFGVEEFTAIINPPDACILAIGGIKQTAVVKDGQLVVGNVMKVTLSSDHRVVDGALGATFLKTFKGLLEDPVRILI